MQEVVYRCDQCEEIIGDKNHISANFSNHSGIAIPPDISDVLNYETMGRKPLWKVKNSLQGKFMHFCNGKCIGDFFRKLLKEVETNAKN